MPEKAHFSSKLFTFLRELKRNNERTWFEANKQRYTADVRDPCLQFVEDFVGPLKKIAPHVVADPRPVGGSLFRIYRDVRFAKDKSPYKTHVGIHFRHERTKDVHAPGFYLHLEPGNTFFGAGIWRPDGKALAGIRNHIVANPASWGKLQRAKAFRDRFTLAGDVLKRPPRGFDPEHEHIEDLKRKDLLIVCNISQKDACAPSLLQSYGKICRAAAPFVEYLAEALELEW